MSSSSSVSATLLLLGCLLLHGSFSQAQLTPSFYDQTCPTVFDIVRTTIVDELRSDPRIAASILRLHFHDCFVRGCDASILLDSTSSFQTEKEAAPNNNSARGFNVINRMKASIEEACPGVVSCADTLTIAARDSVVLSQGPSWDVPLGRRDSLESFFDLANSALPAPTLTFEELKQNFANVTLDRPSDLAALSGGHTFGRAQCRFILARLYDFNDTGLPDPTLNTTYLDELRQLCPQNGNQSALADFDPVTPDLFDNNYYSNLRIGKGLIQTDQELFSTDGADTIPLVELYSRNTSAFFEAFAESMIRMGNIAPLVGNEGEIRLNCSVVNSQLTSVVNFGGSVSSI